MKGKFSNILFNSAYQIFLIIVPIITAPYLSRVLGATNMGKYSYLETMQTIFTTLGQIGLHNYGIREIAYVRDKGKEAISKVFFEITIARFLLMGITSITFILFGNTTQYSVYFYMCLLWIIGNFIDSTWFFTGLEKIKLVVIRNFFIRIITVILIFVLVKTRNDLYLYFLIIGFGQMCSAFSLTPYIIKEIQPTKVTFKGVKRHLIPSIKVFLPQIATLIYTQVDKIMLEGLTTEVANVSFYDNAEKLVKVPLALITSINTVLMPNNANLFMNHKIQELKEQLSTTIVLVAMIAFPMAFGIASIGFTLIPWYLGEEFTTVGYVMIFLAPIIVAMALSGISADQYFVATSRTNILTFTYVTTAILNVIINYLLIPKYGCYGAAIATVISEFLSVIIQYYYLNKFMNVVKPILKSLKYGVYSAIIAAISVWIGLMRGVGPITNLLQVLAAVAVYGFLLIITKDSAFFSLKDTVFNTFLKKRE